MRSGGAVIHDVHRENERRVRADGFEERDLLPLLEHHHDEGRDDRAGRDEDDEAEHEAHPDLLDEERREEAVVQLRPRHRVVDAVVQPPRDLLHRDQLALRRAPVTRGSLAVKRSRTWAARSG